MVIGSCLLIGSIAGCGGKDSADSTTSGAPTTPVPTTAVPTTAVPTTDAPATTVAPTTAVPTTDAPATTVAPTTAVPTKGALTLEEATTVIDGVLAAFNAHDLDAVSAIVGDGKWFGIAGAEFDRTTVGPYLAPLLAPIDNTVVNGEPSPVAGGYAFPLKEHTAIGFNNYYIIVYTDAAGGLTIRESTGPALPG
jgi:hypothetical protein